MFGGDGDKSHIAMGLFIGASQRANRAEGDKRTLVRDLEETKQILDMHAGDAITRGADRDAWRELALVMVDELKHPEKPKRFSDPSADAARANLLQQVHRQSYENSVKRGRITGLIDYAPEAYKLAKEDCLKIVRGYPDDVKASESQKIKRDNKKPENKD